MDSNFVFKLLRKLQENVEKSGDVKSIFLPSEEVVSAHSVLLAASCPYFKTLLFGPHYFENEAEVRDITNETVNLVNFNEESKRFFLLFLKYVYKGDIDIGSLSEDELIGVYSLSREFKFPELAHILSNALSSVFLCVENVGKIFDMARRYDLRDLLKRCISFAEINSTEILSNDDVWVKLPYQLVDELFKSDTFYVNEEVQLFIAVEKWSKSNSTVDPSSALDSIRLEHIDAKSFGIHCKNSNLSDVDKWFKAHERESKRPKRSKPKINLRNEAKQTKKAGCRQSLLQRNFAYKLMSDLYLNDQLSDVAFVFGNESVAAHKIILASCCEHFQSLIDSDLKVRKMYIEDISPQSFKLVLNFIYRGELALNDLPDEATIDLYTVAKKIELAALLDLVSKALLKIRITFENFSRIYDVAENDDNLKQLSENCVIFIENNARTILANKDMFTKLPLALVEKIINFDMKNEFNLSDFKALMEWKEANQEVDISCLLQKLCLNSISAKDFAEHIRPTKFITDDQYFEACAHGKEEEKQAVSNLSCQVHTDSTCEPKVVKVFSKHPKATTVAVCTRIDISDSAYLCNSEGECLLFELDNCCYINYIKFRLFDHSLRLFSYEMRVGQRRESLQVVKQTFPARDYASLQEVLFDTQLVKYIQISSTKDSEPLQLFLNSIECKFDSNLARLAVSSPLNYSQNMIVSLPIDEKAKIDYAYLFNFDSNNEVIYMLRYPCIVASLTIHFNKPHDLHLKIYVKSQKFEAWKAIGIVKKSLTCSKVVLFKPEFVSFLKIEAPQVKQLIRSCVCPSK